MAPMAVKVLRPAPTPVLAWSAHRRTNLGSYRTGTDRVTARANDCRDGGAAELCPAGYPLERGQTYYD
jgi:hypothetical protein